MAREYGEPSAGFAGLTIEEEEDEDVCPGLVTSIEKAAGTNSNQRSVQPLINHSQFTKASNGVESSQC